MPSPQALAALAASHADLFEDWDAAATAFVKKPFNHGVLRVGGAALGAALSERHPRWRLVGISGPECAVFAPLLSARAERLEALELSGDVGDVGHQAIASAIARTGVPPSLRTLVMDKVAVRANSTATALDLLSAGLQGCHMVCVAAVLGNGAMPSLQQLNLVGNCIGQQGALALAEAAGSGAIPRIETLLLLGNHIGDDGLRALAKAATAGAMSQLRELDISKNEIGDEGLCELASALAKHAMLRLEMLDVSGNMIADVGVRALARAMAGGATPDLQTLLLRGNHIGNGGLSALAAEIWFCRGAMVAVQVLSLANNVFDDHGLRALTSAVANGGVPNITSLHLYGNPRVSDEGLTALESALTSRSSVRPTTVWLKEASNPHFHSTPALPRSLEDAAKLQASSRSFKQLPPAATWKRLTPVRLRRATPAADEARWTPAKARVARKL